MRASVVCVGAAPSAGSRCTNSLMTGACSQTASSSLPSTTMVTLAGTACASKLTVARSAAAETEVISTAKIVAKKQCSRGRCSCNRIVKRPPRLCATWSRRIRKGFGWSGRSSGQISGVADGPYYKVAGTHLTMHWTDHKTVGLQYALTALGFLLVGFLLMLLMRWQLAWPTVAAAAGHRRRARRGQRAGRLHAARVLQPARRHARHGDDLSRRRAAAGRRVWQLPGPAADWRTGHGVSASQRGQLLDLSRGRPADAGELLRARRRGQLRLDVVSAAGRSSRRAVRTCGWSASSSSACRRR